MYRGANNFFCSTNRRVDFTALHHNNYQEWTTGCSHWFTLRVLRSRTLWKLNTSKRLNSCVITRVKRMFWSVFVVTWQMDQFLLGHISIVTNHAKVNLRLPLSQTLWQTSIPQSSWTSIRGFRTLFNNKYVGTDGTKFLNRNLWCLKRDIRSN